MAEPQTIIAKPSYWDRMPTEIMELIFQNLDFESLRKCRHICCKWKIIIETMKGDEVWKRFIYQKCPSKFHPFLWKSDMPVFKLFKSISSWQNVHHTKCNKPAYIEFGEEIRTIHVYKATLIVVFFKSFNHYKISDFTLLKHIKRACLDVQESESLNAELTESRTLRLYGKSTITSYYENELPGSDDHKDIILFRITDNKCYFVNKSRAIWLCEWTGKTWRQTVLAKFYGTEVISNICIWEEEVYLVMEMAIVYKVLRSMKCLQKVPSQTGVDKFPLILNLKKSISTVDVTSPSPHNMTRNMGDVIRFKPTCMLEHGNLLFLGYENGMIDIASYDGGAQHTRLLKLSKINNIKALDIHEAEGYHVLLVLDGNTIFRISMRHTL